MSGQISIAFLQTPKWQEEYLREQLAQIDGIERIDFFKQSLSDLDPQQLEGYEIISPFVQSYMTTEVIEQLPNLKYITTRSTGYDHIDLKQTEKQGIAVSNVPSYGMNTVAEHAFALLLSLAHNIPESVERTRQGDFDREGLLGFDLQGKTMGVIGTGRIGAHTVKIAYGFGMKVIAYDPYPNKDLQKEYNLEYFELDELLGKSDVISLHVPYLPETHHLLNQKNINKLKDGAVVINTARGALIENDALIAALRSGKVAAAGLDVIEGEKDIENEKDLYDKEVSREALEHIVEGHALLQMDNVIITQHNAFQTREAIMRIMDTTVENIKGFISGQPINIVKNK